MHRVNWHGSGPGRSGWGDMEGCRGGSIAWTTTEGKLRSGNRAGWQNRKNAPSEGITNGIAQPWPILERVPWEEGVNFGTELLQNSTLPGLGEVGSEGLEKYASEVLTEVPRCQWAKCADTQSRAVVGDLAIMGILAAT